MSTQPEIFDAEQVNRLIDEIKEYERANNKVRAENAALKELLLEVLSTDESVEECLFCMSVPTGKDWRHVFGCLTERIRTAVEQAGSAG